MSGFSHNFLKKPEKWENHSFYPFPVAFWTYMRGFLHGSTFNLCAGLSNWNDIKGQICKDQRSFLVSSNHEAWERQREARTAVSCHHSSPHCELCILPSLTLKGAMLPRNIPILYSNRYTYIYVLLSMESRPTNPLRRSLYHMPQIEYSCTRKIHTSKPNPQCDAIWRWGL